MTSGRRTEPCVGPIARSRSACKELRNRAARRIGRRSVPPLTGFRSAQKRNPGRERPRVWPRYAAQRPFWGRSRPGFRVSCRQPECRAAGGPNTSLIWRPGSRLDWPVFRMVNTTWLAGVLTRCWRFDKGASFDSESRGSTPRSAEGREGSVDARDACGTSRSPSWGSPPRCQGSPLRSDPVRG